MDVRLSLLAALAVALLAGCTGDEAAPPPPSAPTESAPATTTEPAPVPPATTEPEPEAEPVALVPMPAQAARRCRRFPDLARACPRVVPEAPWDRRSPIYQAISSADFPRDGAWSFTLSWGGEHPGRPELDRPPGTVHLVVTALPHFPVALPSRTAVRDGLLAAPRGRVLFLGQRTWGEREGVLLLAPPYPRGGIESNHLVFRWTEDGTKSVSLHGWEPFTEVPEILQAMVDSIPPPR